VAVWGGGMSDSCTAGGQIYRSWKLLSHTLLSVMYLEFG